MPPPPPRSRDRSRRSSFARRCGRLSTTTMQERRKRKRKDGPDLILSRSHRGIFSTSTSRNAPDLVSGGGHIELRAWQPTHRPPCFNQKDTASQRRTNGETLCGDEDLRHKHIERRHTTIRRGKEKRARELSSLLITSNRHSCIPGKGNGEAVLYLPWGWRRACI